MIKLKNIQQLNDDIRRGLVQDVALLLHVSEGRTCDDFKHRCWAAVAEFDAFTQVDDPYCRRESGRFILDGKTLFFKLLHFDRTMSERSENEMSESLSRRVLLIHD